MQGIITVAPAGCRERGRIVDQGSFDIEEYAELSLRTGVGIAYGSCSKAHPRLVLLEFRLFKLSRSVALAKRWT